MLRLVPENIEMSLQEISQLQWPLLFHDLQLGETERPRS